jgi:hypothetical protein
MVSPESLWMHILCLHIRTCGKILLAPKAARLVADQVFVRDCRGMGATMARLLDPQHAGRARFDIPIGDERLRLECHHQYPELAKLVQSCLRLVPSERPTFSDLKRTIRRHIDDNKDIRHRGVSFMPGENYKVGMAYQAAKQLAPVLDDDNRWFGQVEVRGPAADW